MAVTDILGGVWPLFEYTDLFPQHFHGTFILVVLDIYKAVYLENPPKWAQ